MRHCPHCNATIKGEWEQCPLCQTTLDEATDPLLPDPYPKIPLRFNKEVVWKYLTLISFVLIIAFLLIELIWIGRMENLQFALFGILSMWLSVLILIRKRRNIAKGIVYLIVSLSLLCIYLDYLSGWSGWSTTYAVPIICSFAIVSLYIAVRLVNLGVKDYVLYLLTAALAGAFAGAVPDLGRGHDVIALKPVGHDECSHSRHYSALSRRRNMARVGETDACLKRDAAEISEIGLYGTKQKKL